MARLASQHPTHPLVLTRVVVVAGGANVVALAASAAVQAGLTVSKDRTDAKILSTTRRVFVLGGPVAGVANGILTAATAVAGRDSGLLGKTGVVVGQLSTGANLITPAYFRWEPAG